MLVARGLGPFGLHVLEFGDVRMGGLGRGEGGFGDEDVVDVELGFVLKGQFAGL